MQIMLLNVDSKEVRYALLVNGKLRDLVLERKRARQLAGNIYRGRVTNILHNIQSAFINIDDGENGFIHISDILENTQKFEQMFEMDFKLDYDISSIDTKEKSNVDIAQLLKLNQTVLVQVIKEPIGTKGARLTSNISLAGRYLVLLPNSPHVGVSRKIEDRKIRMQLKRIIRSLNIPNNTGIICRTASKNATEEALIEEAKELLELWEGVMTKFQKVNKPTCLYEESDLVKRTIVQAVDKKVSRLLVNDYATFQLCKRLYKKYMEEHPLRIEYYRDKTPMFERFNVEREIERCTQRKIWLPSGGYLFFDHTEAMHTIDVNSGRSTTSNTSNVEETLVHLNLEAAEEIARQLTLRNIGGLIICDFIDMRYKKNQRRVLDRLKQCMKEDSAKCTILGMSEFGLVEMTRQRQRESLMQTLFTECLYCKGAGLIKTHESTSLEIERALKKVIGCQQQYALRLVTHPYLDEHLSVTDKNFLELLAEELNARIEFSSDSNLHLNDFQFISTTNGKQIEL
ncbi:ribonuclease E/G [Simkania negevensis]|uniref:Ribonuclease E/G n=1 Tax=Simkania negevensis TaxID=83561 RepID=A0ABS3ATB8_9BACT|nr:ribonuclease E/G [Simkania negevensis]